MAREMITTGNELAALAAIESGCNFYGGYPITPSSDIMHEMSVMLPKSRGRFIQMEDEIAGISVALGAAMTGAKSMTASSGPGISLKSEQIGLGFIAEIPIVIVNVMRGGPSTGLPTRVSQGDVLQARAPTHGDFCSISLCPGTLAECYTETARAFNLANRFMTPVFLLLDETIGHMYAKALIPEKEETAQNIVPRKEFTGDPADYEPYRADIDQPAVLNPFFKGYRYHITGLHHGTTGFPTEGAATCQYNSERLMNKITMHTDEIISYEEHLLDDAEYLILAYGSVSLSAKEAIKRLRKEGVKIGMFRPITLWPSPSEQIEALGKRFDSDKILCVELNMGQYAMEAERVMKKNFENLNKANGRTISPKEIIEKIKTMAG